MNRLPEHPENRPDEAALEDRIRAAESAPSDPELNADWALRQELRELAADGTIAAGLPADLRRAVLAHADATGEGRSSGRRSRWQVLPVALAAGLAGLLVLATVLRPVDGPAVGPVVGPVGSSGTVTVAEATSTEDLRLALVTVDRTSRRALQLAGREVGEHLEFPSIEIERLPYGRLLTSMRFAPPKSHQPPES